MDELVDGMANDVGENVYTVGNFSGSADFDPGAEVFKLTSAYMELEPSRCWAPSKKATRKTGGF